MTVSRIQESPPGNLAIRKLAITTAHSPDKVQHDSVCVTPTTSKSNTLQRLSDIVDHQDANAVTNEGVFRSPNWMISVSSVMAEGELDVVTARDASQDRFIVIVSEPEREYTLFRNRNDFLQLHETILATGTTPPRLPTTFMATHDRTYATVAPQIQESITVSPSKKPKRRPSFFLAKVKSMFQDSQPAKTIISQPRPAIQQKPSTSAPPISPPHPPGGDPSAKIGAFAFENPEAAVAPASLMYGTREELSSLTPSNSNTADVHGARSQRISQNSTASLKAYNHLFPPISLSGVSRSAAAVPHNASPELLAPPSLESARLHQQLDPTVIPPVNANKTPSPQGRPSNGLDDLEFNRTDVALADYLIALCSQPTARARDVLREFFRVRGPATSSLSDSAAGPFAHTATPIYPAATESFNSRNIVNAEGTGAAAAEVKSSKVNAVVRDSCGDDHIAHDVRLGVSDREGQAMRGDVRARRQSEPNRSETRQNVQPTSSDTSPSPSDAVASPDHGSGGLGVRSGQQRKVTIDDFDLIRTLGKGCAGKVVLVRHKDTRKVFALKAMGKKQVIAQHELDHALIEQAVLKRMSSGTEEDRNPFVVKLWWSFHDEHNLYLVLDFHPGGDLATQLSRWGRLGRDRARFYTSEIVEGVEGLHAAGVIYRDLKPENVLLAQDGHVVLVDFGLAADFYPTQRSPGCILPHWMMTESAVSTGITAGRSELHRHITDGVANKERDFAKSFVGTAEYLAPEVIRGLPYSYEVDWFSLGTMLFEALVGHTPFWANNHSEMYMNVLHNELIFLEDSALDRDTRSFIRGLLCKDPEFRLKEPRIKKHPYLSIVDFDHVRHRRYIPPYIPPTDSSLEFDTSNFDKAFLRMDTSLKRESVEADAQRGRDNEALGLNDAAFAAYDFVDEQFVAVDLNDNPPTQATGQIITGANDSSADGQDKDSTDTESDPGSLSASTSISSLGSENGLGVPAMQGIPEEREADISTETATTQQEVPDERAYTAIDRASRDITAAMKQRIQTLASDPCIKSSSRHSRDTTRASVELAVEESADEWTILDAKPEDQAPNGRTVKQPLSAQGVVDMYRLALYKRRTGPRKKPSWRSPSSSLIFGKASGNIAKGNDAERASPGFLTPLSPTLADFKVRLKNRNGKKKAAAKKPPTPGGNRPSQASGNESSDESGIFYSGGATPARYASSKSVSSREHLDGR